MNCSSIKEFNAYRGVESLGMVPRISRLFASDNSRCGVWAPGRPRAETMGDFSPLVSTCLDQDRNDLVFHFLVIEEYTVLSCLKTSSPLCLNSEDEALSL
jgi:hypothetical protein